MANTKIDIYSYGLGEHILSLLPSECTISEKHNELQSISTKILIEEYKTIIQQIELGQIIRIPDYRTDDYQYYIVQ